MTSQQQIWNSPAGVVERRNYDNMETMSGIIAPTGATSIRLQFTSFSTESGYDLVTVTSCISIDCLHGRVLGSYSGWKDSTPVISDTGVMLIQWRTDGSVTSSGWSATWVSDFAGFILTDTTKPLLGSCL
jgi:hypothetical protein